MTEERAGAHEERVGALEQTSGHINGGARYERSQPQHPFGGFNLPSGQVLPAEPQLLSTLGAMEQLR